MSDEQDKAEALDDEVLDADSDIVPDFSAENDLEHFPGDRYVGVNQYGTTEAEAAMPESDEMRSAREEPDDAIEALQREVSRSDDDERFARSQREAHPNRNL
jgi:hypothetical protein